MSYAIFNPSELTGVLGAPEGPALAARMFWDEYYWAVTTGQTHTSATLAQMVAAAPYLLEKAAKGELALTALAELWLFDPAGLYAWVSTWVGMLKTYGGLL